jgi:hypothetical protein
MIRRIVLFILVLITAGTFSISCSEDIPDCPSRMCIVAGGWQLTEVYVDDDLYTGDVSQYRLILNTPAPATATTSGFSRVQPSGETDAGSWSLENDETILRLIPNDNDLLAEDWIIESMTPRTMVLIINRDVGIKEGPGKIEFILEPF